MRHTFSAQGNMLAASTTALDIGKRRFEMPWRFALICLCTPFLFGCGILAKNYIPDELMASNVDKSMAPYVTEDERVDLSKVDLSFYDDANRKAERARLIGTLVTLSDRKCERHKATIMSNANNWNVATGAATILFAGYASVAGSAHAAANAAAAAAATTGIQGQFNQEVYQGKLSTAILRAIDVARTKAYIKVTKGLETANYPTVQLVGDISQYHASCSLMAGVTELTRAIEDRKPSRAELDRDIVRLKLEIIGAPNLLTDPQIADLKAQLGRRLLDLDKTSD